MKRRRLQPEARRVELLEAALSVLRSRGPLNARVEDVTEAAGAAKGTFYLYFSSWEEMLAQVRAHILSRYIVEIKKRFKIEKKSDWMIALKNECIHFIDFREDLGELHNVIFHGQAADYIDDEYTSARGVLSWMLKLGIEIGACRHIDAEIGGQILFSIFHTTADYIVETGERGKYLDETFDLLQLWLCKPNTCAA